MEKRGGLVMKHVSSKPQPNNYSMTTTEVTVK